MNDIQKTKAGYVAVIGKPNVGKSTLINALLGQTIAPVSQRPQTTRTNMLGILTTKAEQIIFVDTPGIHKPKHRLGSEMNAASRRARLDADVILTIFDISEPPDDLDRRVVEYVEQRHAEIPEIIVLNKVDLIAPDHLATRWDAYVGIFPWEIQPIGTVATEGHNLDGVLSQILAILPAGDFYYPKDQITSAYEREISSDLIRAAAMDLLHKEVPYGILVRIDEYLERGPKGAYIEATLFVDRESHKGIVIGKGGSMIKQIGSNARANIEAMSDRKVFLELKVKVLEGWRDNPTLLQQFGLAGQSRVKK